MNWITLSYAIVLLMTGLLSYFVWSHQESVTALIPSFFAVSLFLCFFFLPSQFQLRVFALITLLLLVGTFPGILKLGLLLRGEVVARPLAVKVQSFTAIVSFFYLLSLAFFNGHSSLLRRFY